MFVTSDKTSPTDIAFVHMMVQLERRGGFAVITIKQLEALYWVGKLGSFSAAANKLNIAQSTISKRIQELEDSLQATFFERDKRAGRLTMKGAEILPLAEEMLRLQKRL